MDKGLTIVICDDDPVMRTLAGHLAQDEGFEVIAELDSAYAAIQVARACQPDVIVLDLVLNDFSGEHALPSIREASPSSAILIWSGFDSSFDFEAYGATVAPKGGLAIVDALARIRQARRAHRSVATDAALAHQARKQGVSRPICYRRAG